MPEAHIQVALTVLRANQYLIANSTAGLAKALFQHKKTESK